jgi:hypothetical protein
MTHSRRERSARVVGEGAFFGRLRSGEAGATSDIAITEAD